MKNENKIYNILLFDYTPDFFHLLKRAIDPEKFNIKYSDSTSNFNELIENENPDCIIINDILQGISGIELCSKISEANKDVIMILLTENKDIKYKYLALTAGVMRLVEKPIKIQEFINILKETMIHRAGIKMNKFVSNWFEFNINSKEEFARDVSILIKGLLENEKIDRHIANKISFILTEIQNNAIEHAHKNNIEKVIKISCILTENALNIKIEDEGAGFDYSKLDSVPDSKSDILNIAQQRKLEGKRPGGFGLILAKKVMDEIIFNDKGNIILMSKRLK